MDAELCIKDGWNFTIADIHLGDVESSNILCKEIAKRWNEFKELEANQSQWISVNDAIPKDNAEGICKVKFVDDSIDEMTMRKVSKWVFPYTKGKYVTHWKPIAKPKEVKEWYEKQNLAVKKIAVRNFARQLKSMIERISST